ncbi:hypothetical protein Tco_0882291 [Tanacetum coccineum]
MPPRRLKKKFVKSSGGNTGNAGGTMNVQGCSHKTFMNGKPHSFNGTEGVVGLRRWMEKVEQVFEICKCDEEDKVMFAASTFEGRALTWWNGNVHTLGLVNANRDDIEAYNNRFHELALMCPELVPTEKKKIERYVRRFPERIKGNITSSKPATLHDAINMAHNTLTLNPLNPSYMHHCHVGNPTFLNVKSNGCDDFKKAQVTPMVKIEASNLSHKKHILGSLSQRKHKARRASEDLKAP